MNMDFGTSQAIDVAPRALRPRRSELKAHAGPTDGSRWAGYAGWAAIAGGACYAALHASTLVLLIAAGVIVALAALATAICAYALNNSIW